MAARYAAPKKKPKQAKKAPPKNKPAKAEKPAAAAAAAALSASDAQAHAWLQLTPKQQAFCTEYLRSKNAEAACIAAYGNTNNKVRTYEHPAVKAFLELMMAPVMEKMAITNEWIIEQFAAMANSKDAPPAAKLRALENLAELRSMYPPRQLKHTEDDPLVNALREALDGVPAPAPVATSGHARTN